MLHYIIFIYLFIEEYHAACGPCGTISPRGVLIWKIVPMYWLYLLERNSRGGGVDFLMWSELTDTGWKYYYSYNYKLLTKNS